MLSSAPVMTGSYDYPTVALSFLVAVSASYAALDLAGRVTAARSSARAAWLAGGAAAMGLGIWSMHFIGMLAFHLPVAVSYHWPTVLVSGLAGTVASAVALYVVSREKMDVPEAIAGSFIMGAGIAAMHYIGMAAMRLPAVMQFDRLLVSLSVVLAVVFSLAALLLAFDLRKETKETTPRKIGSAIVLGIAICVMHYTAMAAANFRPAALSAGLSRTLSISALGTAGIATVTLTVLGLAVLASSIERQHYAEALTQLEGDYRLLVERAPYGIFRSTRDGRLLMVNPALVRMLGYASEAELLKANLNTDIYVRRADRENVITLHSNGDRTVDTELEWKRKDGRQIRVRAHGRAIGDKTEAMNYFEVIIEDITERKLLENQARRAQKMEAVGQFAEGIAHDFNNLLQVILGQSQLISKQIDANSDSGVRLQHVLTAAERAKWLTTQLLLFGRQEAAELQVIDPNAVLAELRTLLEHLIGDHIVLVTELSPELWRVRSERERIQQVIMNLAANARDAMPDGGTVKIVTENAEINESAAAEHPGVPPPGRYVVLAVSDSGTGMDKATLAHIFEPFFTSKGPGKGTGLGLTVVHNIVTQQGGYITLQSQPGRGSTFNIYLPAVEEAAPAPAAERNERGVPRGSETVLLVEDSQSVRILIRDYLESSGYTVLEAQDGEQAMELARKHRGPVHLVLTDVVMPRIGGPQLARRLKAILPESKVLYMSGYTSKLPVADEKIEQEEASPLQKPFTAEDLLWKVRSVLDRGGARNELQ
jgi:PAS domain S-box-containing protein